MVVMRGMKRGWHVECEIHFEADTDTRDMFWVSAEFWLVDGDNHERQQLTTVGDGQRRNLADAVSYAQELCAEFAKWAADDNW